MATEVSIRSADNNPESSKITIPGAVSQILLGFNIYVGRASVTISLYPNPKLTEKNKK